MSSVTTFETLHSTRSDSPDISSGKTLPRPPRRRFWHTSWIWETLSLLLSISCITAVVILLLFYNGKTIPNWSFLTLNAAISILAVVAKSALLVPVSEAISQLKWYWFFDARQPQPLIDFQHHDAASRGPWGSLVFLLRPRTWHVVSVGALVTVFALGMEPALQQVQTYAVRTVAVNGPAATISRVTNYTDLVQDGTDYAEPLLGAGIRGAVYSGLYSSASSFDQLASGGSSASCPTGNCTWPTYSSLEICSACQNLTMQVQNITTKARIAWQLDNNTQIDSNTNIMTMSTLTDETFAFEAMNESLVLDAVTMYFPPGMQAKALRPHAYECVLYYCIKTYNTTMVNGSLQEQAIASWPDINSPPPLSDLNQTGTAYIDPILGNGEILAERYYNRSWTLYPGPHPGRANETFEVNLLTFFYLRMWLQKLIAGSIFTDPEALGASDMVLNLYQQMSGTQHEFVYRKPTRSLFMPGPDAMFERLAKSMTAYMLSQSRGRAIGSAFSSETYVRVRWAWAILPVSLVLLTAALVIVTVALSAKRSLPSWKSSALPSLFHGLSEQEAVLTQVSGSESTGIMEKRSRHLRVALNDYGGDVRLRSRGGTVVQVLNTK